MTSVGLGRPWLALFGLVRTTWDLTKMTDCWKASIARAPGITQSPPRGVGTLAEDSGWAARFLLAEALVLLVSSIFIDFQPNFRKIRSSTNLPSVGYSAFDFFER